MNVLRSIYKFWAALLVLAIVVQIGAAGYGAFYVAGRLDDKGEVLTHKGFENGWDFHSGFGYFVFLWGVLKADELGVLREDWQEAFQFHASDFNTCFLMTADPADADFGASR